MKQERVRLYHSLYFRISITVILLLVFVGLLEFYIASRGYRSIVARIQQQIEWDVAAHAANAIQEELLEPLSAEEFPRLIHPMAQINPRLEWYLLHADGRVFAFHNAYDYVVHEKVDLGPIHAALEPIAPPLPHRGQDPFDGRRLGAPWLEENGVVFSVAPIRFNDEDGFLYVVLDGADFLKLLRQSGQFFLARLLTTGWLISLLAATVLGLLLFRSISRRFRSLAVAIGRYESGDYAQPLANGSKDEIGMLSRTLDAMAARLIDAKQEIETRDSMRRELIAGIAHDLRSPLQSTLAHIDLAQESQLLSSDPGARESLAAALDSTLMQKRLVEDLFELSALEAKEREPNLDAISLEHLVRQLQQRYAKQLTAADVTLHYHARGEVAEVLADPTLLQRVFSNLLDNSLRFVSAGGSITISADFADEEVEICVQDSGATVPAAQEESGSQSEESGRFRTARGAGLGLSIVRRIVELHGGSLSIDSKSEGGFTLRFTLPLEC